MRKIVKMDSGDSGLGYRKLVAAMSVMAAAVALVWAPLPGKDAVAQSLDLDVVFWCDEEIGPMGVQTEEECLASRAVLLSNCTVCHSFAPIVLAEKTQVEWEVFLGVHRARAPAITDEEFEQLREFIGTRYTPDNPVPELPEVLRNYTLPPA